MFWRVMHIRSVRNPFASFGGNALYREPGLCVFGLSITYQHTDPASRGEECRSILPLPVEIII